MIKFYLYRKYQSSWFSCSSSEYYDLESKQWTTNWDSQKILVSDNELSPLQNYCRGLDYYIDPLSIETVELGTQEFPYRTIAPVFAEILKHMSHSDLSISIWVKEGTTLTVEDSQIFIFNITEVSISTYSDISSNPGYATLISTDLPVEKLSKKSKFNIIKNTDLNVSDAISKGDFSDIEIAFLGRTGDTFQIWRSSFTMSNFTVKRFSNDLNIGLFLFPIYFQERALTLSKY